MIRIAVCDDNYQVCEQLEKYIECLGKGRDIEQDIFTSGIEFDEALRENHYDLIFLDVVMRDKNGIELGRVIREELYDDSSLIIYISSYGQTYAMELFQFQPFYFLKKPIDSEAFQHIFYKACEKIEGNAGIFEFKSGRTIYRIPLKDIRYFEGDNRRVRIVVENNVYHCYSTIEKLFSKIHMEEVGFLRLHKSYAVNLRYVASFSVRNVTLFGGEKFTISAPFKENALRQYDAYCEKLGAVRRTQLS